MAYLSKLLLYLGDSLVQIGSFHKSLFLLLFSQLILIDVLHEVCSYWLKQTFHIAFDTVMIPIETKNSSIFQVVLDEKVKDIKFWANSIN